MKNPLRKKKQTAQPKPSLREQALARITITDTDRMDRLVKHSGASREEIDAMLRADRKWLRKKLLHLRLERNPYRITWQTSEQYEREAAIMAEIDRILVEECA